MRWEEQLPPDALKCLGRVSFMAVLLGRCPFIPVCLSVPPSPHCSVFGSAASPWAAPLHPRSLQTSPLLFSSRNHNFHPLKTSPGPDPLPMPSAVNEWLVAL